MTKRKICVVTGTRAEYGLLYWLMKEIEADPQLELQVIVTGMHLAPQFGLTFKLIEDDGFSITAKVDMLLAGDNPQAVTKSIGLGVIGFADVLDNLKPDILVLLGDRYEILAAAQAALVARIPVAHIHGGESTEGAIDEAIRHTITKMAHVHFTAAEPYRQRVIQLGEQPERVFNVGAPGLDNINKLKLLSATELSEQIGFTFGAVNLLVTYHPVTLYESPPETALFSLFKALDDFPQAKIIFTKANSDTYGCTINKLTEAYVARNQERASVYASLGQLRYLSMLKLANAVIGNSSSGIIEAPILQTPTVNIGKRQCGRLRANSIIDCGETYEEIQAAIHKALSLEFRANIAKVKSPYGEGNSSLRIKEILKDINLDGIIIKQFYKIDGYY